MIRFALLLTCLKQHLTAVVAMNQYDPEGVEQEFILRDRPFPLSASSIYQLQLCPAGGVILVRLYKHISVGLRLLLITALQ